MCYSQDPNCRARGGVWNAFPKFNPLSLNPTNWSNTLKKFVCFKPTNCLSVLDYIVVFAFKRWIEGGGGGSEGKNLKFVI